MSLKRIRKEIRDMKENVYHNFTAGPEDEKDITKWIANIIGPEDTPYSGGVFKLSIDFPSHYPFTPPKICFKTKIYHCNINAQGKICLDILKTNWSPALSISKVLLSISSLLAECNPDDPLVPYIADQYRKNKKEHDEIAKRWTQIFAG
jgi:ubiquitin-conjugating enzyme E2 D/E